jgi:hypothetical protein
MLYTYKGVPRAAVASYAGLMMTVAHWHGFWHGHPKPVAVVLQGGARYG